MSINKFLACIFSRIVNQIIQADCSCAQHLSELPNKCIQKKIIRKYSQNQNKLWIKEEKKEKAPFNTEPNGLLSTPFITTSFYLHHPHSI